MNDNYIRKFYTEICYNLNNNYKIVLEPNKTLKEDWIEYDTVPWEMEQPVKEFVDDLLLEETLSLEEKIIKVYEFICLRYIYDANALYFCKKDCKDINNIKYLPVDWYGRVVGKEWIEKRKTHNRRICYEFSRCYAKAINTLIGNSKELEAVIVGDKDNTHYVVGLTGEKYSILLDQDDFNSIKDLTRLKMGLTIKGIRILRDKTGAFRNALESFNRDRFVELPEIELARETVKDKDFIGYLNIGINTLKKYNIDSQGFFEYIRFLIESENIEIEKIWKEDTQNSEKRYERCLYFKFNNKTYLLDSINKALFIVDLKDLNTKEFIFNSEENQYNYFGG